MEDEKEYAKIKKYIKFYHISDLINWRDSMLRKSLNNTELYQLINGEIEYRNSDNDTNNLIQRKFFAFLDSLTIKYEKDQGVIEKLLDILPDTWHHHVKNTTFDDSELAILGYRIDEVKEKMKKEILTYLDFLAGTYSTENINYLVSGISDKWRLYNTNKTIKERKK